MSYLRTWPARYIALLALAIALAAPAVGRAATPEEVDRAIDKAKKFIYSKQKEGGHWELDDARKGTQHVHDVWIKMQGDSYGGFTALATYALLASGENPQDKRIEEAVKFLENADVMGIYALGLRAQIWLLLPPSAMTKRMAHKDAKLILDGVITSDPKHKEYEGFWEYGNGHGEDLKKGPRHLDHSVSQYGILGLWACAQNGVEIDASEWQMFEKVWKAHQFPDGGWEYEGYPSHPSKAGETASMTAAGVATLFIIEDILHSDDGINCRGNITNDNIERGLNWMAEHFDKVGANCYALYGVERIGVASGRKYFGTTDWYAKGADRLVKAQQPNGSWKGGGVTQGDIDFVNTSFALLFLTRGRAPVMMNKLQYDVVDETGKTIEGNWNQRPRDIASLAHWTGDQIERYLNFQIVNLKVPVEELHDAPILYLSGNQPLKFKDDEVAKLRQYVEEGGMIVANADCGLAKPLFAKTFEELGKKLFPKYQFRDLPLGNIILSGENYSASNWKEKPRIRALGNGVREMMVILPEADAGRAWQTHAEKTHEELFQLGSDLFLYAVDKRNLRNKGETYIVRANPKIKATRNAKVARLIVGDNWDPEPGGWLRLSAILHNKFESDVTTENVRLGQDRLSPSVKLAHLTGTSRFKLTDAQRAALAEYIFRGGTLVIDAAGGSSEFAESAEAELRTIFGSDAGKALAGPLDIDSPVFDLPKAKIESVNYRDFYKNKVVGKLKAPRLFGIPRGDRVAVFYSREDLSCGMVGQPVDGIAGYSPESATELMRNIALYGAFGERPKK
jgi:hypothetical protein